MLQCHTSCVCCGTRMFLVREDQVIPATRCPTCGRNLLVRSSPFGETEWLSCDDPHLLAMWRDERTTPRKLRLFACAVARLEWDHFTDPRSRHAVEVAERFADGQGGADELRRACWAAQSVADSLSVGLPAGHVSWMAALVAEQGLDLLRLLAYVAPRRRPAPQDVRAANLSRDVMGNPFRPLPVLEEAVPAFNGGVVAGLARAIYEERAFERMPILGDALEEAGCCDPFVLSHCHNGGAHVRGCWVVDLVLQRR